MNVNDGAYFRTRVSEDIVWVFVSFFSLQYTDQEGAFYNSIVKLRYGTDTQNKNESEKLFKMAGCLIANKPDNIPPAAYDRWWDLAAILDKFTNCENPRELLGSPAIWSMYVLKEERVWEAIRRLSREVLEEWGVDPFMFDKKIDLDDIEPDTWWI